MTSKRPKPQTFAAHGGRVIITLTNDSDWAREVFNIMIDDYTARVAKNLDYERSDENGTEDDNDALFEELTDDAFDGGHTTQGHYFFVVTVETDKREDDVFVCSSAPLADTVKDELIAMLGGAK